VDPTPGREWGRGAFPVSAGAFESGGWAVKHLFYAFYVSFYAGAMFVAGLFFGQFMERRWAGRERAEAETAPKSVADNPLTLDERPVVWSGQSNLPTR
jgi:hypothetical protein